MADSIVGAALQGALKGAASGNGTVSAPFKAIQAGGNAIKGIKKSISGFYSPNKNRKTRFRKKNI